GIRDRNVTGVQTCALPILGEKAKGFRPLMELSETVRILREKAKEYWIDPDKIAVCGFSAGGHVAASLGTMWNDPELLKVYDNQEIGRASCRERGSRGVRV